MTHLCIVLSLLVSWVKGSPLEVTSNPVLNTIQYEVDITQCTQIRFRMKTCSGVHIMLGDGSATGSYEIFMGGWKFNMTGFSHCGLNICPNTTVLFATHGLLDCQEYRNFWISWRNGIAFGTGNTPYAGVIVDVPGPLIHDMKVLGHYVHENIPATIKLGDDDSSLFEMVGEDIKYTSTLLADVADTEQFACGLLCHGNTQCGRVSYSHAQKRCQLFDRDVSTSSVPSTASGWDSWRMIYCN